MKKITKFLKWFIITLVSLVIVLAIAFKIYTQNYYRADMTITQNIQELLNNDVSSYSDKNGTVFIPQEKEIKAVIVFYPGGKVEYTSYNGLMYELAARGYLCLLPRMPENLALLRINAVDKVTADYDVFTDETEELDWYLAGHSLGGVAACAHLGNTLTPANDSDESDNPSYLSEYSGIILCASYPTTDLSNTNLRLLSLYGSNDSVLDMEKYEGSKSLWPEDSTEYVIQGGIHSYFGSYGIQNGDGEPTITNFEQITKTANIIDDWINQ